MRIALVFAAAICSAVLEIARADEVVVSSVSLPGAALEQEVTYHPSKHEYETTRDDLLRGMSAGDKSAFVNPADGPWMIVETTAKIGLEYKGVGATQGKKHLRRVTAAEEALFLFEKK